MELGPSFKGLEKLWTGETRFSVDFLVPESPRGGTSLSNPPRALDPCLQPFAAAVMSEVELTSGGAIYMPIGFEGFTIYREPGAELWSSIVVPEDRRKAGAAETQQIDAFIFAQMEPWSPK